MSGEDMEAALDRLSGAYAAAGLPPLRPAPRGVTRVLEQIAAEIAPLTLPDELVAFWTHVDPQSLEGLPHPSPTGPEFALRMWQTHQTDSPGMVPRAMFPVCIDGWWFRLVELHGPDRRGGMVFDWAYGGHPFRRVSVTWTDCLRVFTSLLEAGLVDRHEHDGRGSLRLDDQVWQRALAGRLAAAGPDPVYGERIDLDQDPRSWPAHWLETSPLAGDRWQQGATTTLAGLLAAVGDGGVAEGVVHARVTNLTGTAAGNRVTIDDGTGRVDVWCPAEVCGFGPIIRESFEFDLVVQAGPEAVIDTHDGHREIQARALDGDLSGAADAFRGLWEELRVPTMATARAIRPLA